jgi:hypothetical protein
MKKHIGICIVAALFLVGCGGGGGGGSNSGPVASTLAFNVKIAVANYVSMPHSYNLSGSGTIDGARVTITGTDELSVLTSGTFEGQIALQQTETTNLTVTGNGTSVPLSSIGTSYYLPADYTPLGGESLNQYEVNDPGGTYPTTAKVGDKGLVGTVKLYSNSTKTTQIGSETTSYSIEADTADSVVVTFVTVTNYSAPPPSTETGTSKYRLDSMGTLTPLSDSLVTPIVNVTIMPVDQPTKK